MNVCRERQAYEGEAGARLEAIVDLDAMGRDDEESAYPFAIPNLRDTGLPYIEPLAMWRALLGDLILKTPAPLMAARFHKGLAKIIVAMTRKSAVAKKRAAHASIPSPCPEDAFRTAFCSRRSFAASSRTTSPCSRMLKFPPTTAALRSDRRRSAPRG